MKNDKKANNKTPNDKSPNYKTAKNKIPNEEIADLTLAMALENIDMTKKYTFLFQATFGKHIYEAGEEIKRSMKKTLKRTIVFSSVYLLLISITMALYAIYYGVLEAIFNFVLLFVIYSVITGLQYSREKKHLEKLQAEFEVEAHNEFLRFLDDAENNNNGFSNEGF